MEESCRKVGSWRETEMGFLREKGKLCRWGVAREWKGEECKKIGDGKRKVKFGFQTGILFSFSIFLPVFYLFILYLCFVF